MKFSHSQLSSVWNERTETEIDHHEILAAAVAVVGVEGSHVNDWGIQRSNSKEPTTTRTSFDVAVCWRRYVPAAVALLGGSGKLCLEDPLQTQVPELECTDPWVAKHRTIRERHSDRAALGNQAPSNYLPRANLSGTETLSRNRFIRKAYDFRERFHYASLGFHAEARAVERAFGQPYAAFLEEHLLDPLEMRLAVSEIRAMTRRGNRAAANMKLTEPIDSPKLVPDNMRAQAGIFSCADLPEPLHVPTGFIEDSRKPSSIVLSTNYFGSFLRREHA